MLLVLCYCLKRYVDVIITPSLSDSDFVFISLFNMDCCILIMLGSIMFFLTKCSSILVPYPTDILRIWFDFVHIACVWIWFLNCRHLFSKCLSWFCSWIYQGFGKNQVSIYLIIASQKFVLILTRIVFLWFALTKLAVLWTLMQT